MFGVGELPFPFWGVFVSTLGHGARGCIAPKDRTPLGFPPTIPTRLLGLFARRALQCFSKVPWGAGLRCQPRSSLLSFESELPWLSSKGALTTRGCPRNIQRAMGYLQCSADQQGSGIGNLLELQASSLGWSVRVTGVATIWSVGLVCKSPLPAGSIGTDAWQPPR